MPTKDKTGPEGKGSKTGRQMGDCEDATPIRNGFGGGCRRGFGRRYWCRPPISLSKEAEKKQIESRLKELN
ncbi:MAG: DUF5320 domain-containing protein [Nanoarchaeota archaeon]|nr:DUF5320 domain-containing protein [Nanoarchaeota archaeon]